MKNVTCLETSQSRSVQGGGVAGMAKTPPGDLPRKRFPVPPGRAAPQRWELRGSSAKGRWPLDAWTWSRGKPCRRMYNTHTHSPSSHAIFNNCHMEHTCSTKLPTFWCLGTWLKAAPYLLMLCSKQMLCLLGKHELGKF